LFETEEEQTEKRGWMEGSWISHVHHLCLCVCRIRYATAEFHE